MRDIQEEEEEEENEEEETQCVLKTTRQKWKHFEEMFVRTLHYHQLKIQVAFKP